MSRRRPRPRPREAPALRFTFTRVGKGQRSDTAYGVEHDGVFLGYVVGRDGLWDRQPETDRSVPVHPTPRFTYAQPSRQYVAERLLEDHEAQQEGSQ